LSLGSSETQTGQSQPTIGTPVEVPLPNIVIFIPINFLEIWLKIAELAHAGKVEFGLALAALLA